MEAVASSMRRTFGFLRSARARQRSCLCPCERLDPDSEIVEERLRKTFLFSVMVSEVSAVLPTRVWFVDSVGADSDPALSAVLGLVSSDDEGTFTTSAGVLGREGVGAVELGDPMSCTRRRAVKISSSVNRPNGSRLLRIVPVKSVGSKSN